MASAIKGTITNGKCHPATATATIEKASAV